MVTVLSTTQGLGHGAETVLCEMMSAWPGNGMPLRIAAPRDSRVLACAQSLGYATVPLCARRDALASNAAAVWRAFQRKDDLSLVHAWSARGFEFAYWLKRRFCVPASGTLHDHPRAGFHGRCRRIVMKCAADRLDALVAVSQAVAATARLNQYRVPLSSIHNGINDISCIKTPSKRIRMGFLGMYAAWKGKGIIADWIESLLHLDEVQWCLYGCSLPNVERKFTRLAEQHPDHVKMKGVCMVKEIFSEIDVLVHASTQFDPLPTVLIEASRAGIPCVASRLGGTPEIVIDGQTGFLFDPSLPSSGLVALKRLVSDASLRSAMGLAARQRYEGHFQAGRMARDYQDFWSQLLERRNGRAMRRWERNAV